MIIQGPLHPLIKKKQFPWAGVFGDSIDAKPPISEQRIDFWVKTGIHVKGKRTWIIIKTHTHGATAGDAVLGEEMDNIFNYLETKFNDGNNYILHYVTARELYNIIKAAEAGETGMNPEQYRNYLIKPPRYDSSPIITEASTILKGLIAKTYEG